MGGYFNWDEETTSHQLDASIGIDLSAFNENLPLTLQWNTILAGTDHDEDGERLHSTYIELGYTLPVKDFEVEFTTGFTPWKGMYQEDESFNMVNLSIKGSYEIKMTDKFALPVFAQLTLNPNTESIYFVAGLSF